MKKLLLTAVAIGALIPGVHAQTASTPWYKQPWDASKIQPCDRACLVQIVDNYVNSLVKKDTASVPTSEETWYTENTARLSIGEGILWRARVDPTPSSFTLPILSQDKWRFSLCSTSKDGRR